MEHFHPVVDSERDETNIKYLAPKCLEETAI